MLTAGRAATGPVDHVPVPVCHGLARSLSLCFQSLSREIMKLINRNLDTCATGSRNIIQFGKSDNKRDMSNPTLYLETFPLHRAPWFPPR